MNPLTNYLLPPSNQVSFLTVVLHSAHISLLIYSSNCTNVVIVFFHLSSVLKMQPYRVWVFIYFFIIHIKPFAMSFIQCWLLSWSLLLCIYIFKLFPNSFCTEQYHHHKCQVLANMISLVEYNIHIFYIPTLLELICLIKINSVF